MTGKASVGGVALLLAFPLFGAGGPAAADCPSGGGEAVRVAAVEARAELRLADGRLIRLVGLDPVQGTPETPDRDETARAALAAMLAGRAVTLTPLASARDRWGRWPALVFAADGSGAGMEGGLMGGGLAAAAIAAGLGRYLPEAPAHACRDALLRAEAVARAAKLGLWSDPYYALLDVVDERGFTERSGTRVVASGTVAAVEPGPFRTVLRFEPRDRDTWRGGGTREGTRRMLTATVPARARKMFEAGDVSAFLGKTLRFRGLLDLRFGPQVELAGPDDVEIVPRADSEAAPPASAASSP